MLKQPKTFASMKDIEVCLYFVFIFELLMSFRSRKRTFPPRRARQLPMRCVTLFSMLWCLLMHLKIKKEHISEEEEFPVIKRKAEEVVAERPSKVTKKDDVTTRKKVPVTRQPLKERMVGLNAGVSQFSSSLRSNVSLSSTQITHSLNDYRPLAPG